MAVEDSNDNTPYFTSALYDAVALESSPAGTSVMQVTALDKDNGFNGLLTYSIEAGVCVCCLGAAEECGRNEIPFINNFVGKKTCCPTAFS